MTKFAIVGVRRTGTTLIRTTLNDHPDICCLGEVFNFGDRFGRKTRGHQCEGSYRRYIKNVPFGVARDLFARKHLVKRYLTDLYTDPGHKARGFKFMHSHGKEFPSVLPYLQHNDGRVIHIVRKNLLKVIISRAVRVARGHAQARGPVKTTRINLSADGLIKDLSKIDQQNKSWEEQCQDLPYLKIYYEDFVADKNTETSRMLEHLSVRELPDLKSDLVKINPDDIKQIIINYDEIAETLKDTPFEWCLSA